MKYIDAMKQFVLINKFVNAINFYIVFTTLLDSVYKKKYVIAINILTSACSQ